MNSTDTSINEFTIRREEPADRRRSEEITREAFWNLYCAGCSEHFIVHQMRKAPDFIPELSFVIESGGQMVGCIFYSRSAVVSPDAPDFPVIAFGPVAVLPEFQHKGLGKALIDHSLAAAVKLGFETVVITGAPEYYIKFGFAGGKKYGIAMPDGRFHKALLVLPFPNSSPPAPGRIRFSPAYETDPEQLETFDRSFPAKEKQVLPRHSEFEDFFRNGTE